MPKMSKYHIYNTFSTTVPILGFGILISLLTGKPTTIDMIREIIYSFAFSLSPLAHAHTLLFYNFSIFTQSVLTIHRYRPPAHVHPAYSGFPLFRFYVRYLVCLLCRHRIAFVPIVLPIFISVFACVCVWVCFFLRSSISAFAISNGSRSVYMRIVINLEPPFPPINRRLSPPTWNITTKNSVHTHKHQHTPHCPRISPLLGKCLSGCLSISSAQFSAR